MATSNIKDNDKVTDENDLAPATSFRDTGSPTEEIDYAYLQASKFTKFYKGILFQMILFGTLSFVGPAMNDAISNLGGGGLSTPYLGNLATSLNYVITGFSLGFLYVAESTAMLSYPKANDRGLYLGIWSAMRNSGSVLGGAINFSNNHSEANRGGIALSTYLIFVAFECTSVFWALLLTQTKRVRRADGSKISMSGKATWKQEFNALWIHMKRRKTWLMFIPAFYSFFYGGTMGTYLSLHFSVRARALSSLLVPSLTIVMVVGYGQLLLDNSRWSQAKRAWVAFACWFVPQAACFIWIGIEYKKFGNSDVEALDYQFHTKRWAEAYIPYLIMFSTGYWCQLSLYWILGTFSTDTGSSSRTGGLFRAFETAGQAVSYAINSTSGSDPRTPFYVNAALLGVVVPCMVFLIRLVPETPASEDLDVEVVIEGIQDPNKKQVI
ncbi:hypothetical protein NW762_014454 [Fusarium torreyae]|uniref:UNC93-like protein n=1 Tax=Fusarium torreyae TaxID=1237075 RepID=A0A9W8V9E7_9HYPO|nr:hypothetical protein NW762_014454 [Fusarium torreyae]